jgi:hypothetical protein
MPSQIRLNSSVWHYHHLAPCYTLNFISWHWLSSFALLLHQNFNSVSQTEFPLFDFLVFVHAASWHFPIPTLPCFSFSNLGRLWDLYGVFVSSKGGCITLCHWDYPSREVNVCSSLYLWILANGNEQPNAFKFILNIGRKKINFKCIYDFWKSLSITFQNSSLIRWSMELENKCLKVFLYRLIRTEVNKL